MSWILIYPESQAEIIKKKRKKWIDFEHIQPFIVSGGIFLVLKSRTH